jgi:hypothetical protein
MTFSEWRKSRLQHALFFFKLSLCPERAKRCNFLNWIRYIVVTKQLEIMAIGFDTLSKRQAEETENKNSPQMAQMPSTALQAETYDRVNSLGDMILSPQFASLPVEQKQAMLVDFAYFKNVAESL